jgi:hypothetical protein
MKAESTVLLGDAADTLDNLCHAAMLPMPAHFHLTQLTAALPEIVEKLRAVYVAETGENPWAA